MLALHTTHQQVRTTDAITTAVRQMVVSRDPVTERQFNGVLGLVSTQIRKRFELSQRGAEQAVMPILRSLLPITVSGRGTRRNG